MVCGEEGVVLMKGGYGEGLGFMVMVMLVGFFVYIRLIGRWGYILCCCHR